MENNNMPTEDELQECTMKIWEYSLERIKSREI